MELVREFLVNADKFNLKYVFNNDKFYEPILFFAGWNKVNLLPNNIAIWEKPDIAPLPSILPRKNIPQIQRLMWGILPLACFVNMCFWFFFFKIYRVATNRKVNKSLSNLPILTSKADNNHNWLFHTFWFASVLVISIIIFAYSIIETQPQYSPKNATLSYYNAIDFRNFEEAYSYLNPKENISFEQFTLEQTIEDGILASYAKLDGIETETTFLNNETAKVDVKAKWVTALGDYETEHQHELIKISNKWFLVPEKKSIDIPPDQFINLPNISLHSQGRRLADVNKTRHEDVLDRPQVNLSEVNLVKTDTILSVVGMLQNLDNVPAYISIEVKLYDENNEIIVKQNVNDIIKHNLLPKEVTPFRIKLSNISNSTTLEPINFVVEVKSLVSTEEIYAHTALQNIEQKQHKLSGEFINFGTNEVSIPQLLSAQRNDEGILTWADKFYLESGIRPQRKRNFDIQLMNNNHIEIIKKGTLENYIINGKRMNNTTRISNKLNEKSVLFFNNFVYSN